MKRLICALALAVGMWSAAFGQTPATPAPFVIEGKEVEPLPSGSGKSVWAMGVLVSLKSLGAQTGGAYAIFEDFVHPGVGTPLHFHTREEEFWYMLEGELTWQVGGKVWTAKTGDYVNTPRGVQHRFRNDGDKPARMLLGYAPAGFEQWFLEIGQSAPAPADPMNRPARPTLEDIQKAVSRAKDYGVEFVGPPPGR